MKVSGSLKTTGEDATITCVYVRTAKRHEDIIVTVDHGTPIDCDACHTDDCKHTALAVEYLATQRRYVWRPITEWTENEHGSFNCFLMDSYTGKVYELAKEDGGAWYTYTYQFPLNTSAEVIGLFFDTTHTIPMETRTYCAGIRVALAMADKMLACLV